MDIKMPTLYYDNFPIIDTFNLQLGPILLNRQISKYFYGLLFSTYEEDTAKFYRSKKLAFLACEAVINELSVVFNQTLINNQSPPEKAPLLQKS
ncbi:hypothetical protein DNH61_11920 [Paenibacillus sambharensis]|uniref:Uncharacterized protein n=1 Tax=Paenibacillus sambharensis TaxID=1803190 RepID=A0A2W1L578_9BACL|nr:hypothetical protein DNH61_11920 [Paenibacillus sambharensis]